MADIVVATSRIHIWIHDVIGARILRIFAYLTDGANIATICRVMSGNGVSALVNQILTTSRGIKACVRKRSTGWVDSSKAIRIVDSHHWVVRSLYKIIYTAIDDPKGHKFYGNTPAH